MSVLTSPHLHDNLIAALRWAGHPQPSLFVTVLPPGSLPAHHTTSRGVDRVYCALIATLARHFPRVHPSDLSAHASGALSRLAQMLILPGERTALAAQLHALRDPKVYTTPGMMGHALLAARRTTVPSRAVLTRTHRCECYQNLNIEPVVPGDPDAAVRAALESGVPVTGDAAARITSQGLTTGLIRLEAPPSRLAFTGDGGLRSTWDAGPCHTLTGLADTTLPHDEADLLQVHLTRLHPDVPVHARLSDGWGDHRALREARRTQQYHQHQGVNIHAFWADLEDALRALPFTDEVWTAFREDIDQDMGRDPDEPNPFMHPQAVYFGL